MRYVLMKAVLVGMTQVLAGSSSGYQIHGTVKGVVDLPDYCSIADTAAMGGVQVEVPGIARVQADAGGSFTIAVPSADPCTVVARLISAHPRPFAFEVRRGGVVSEAILECIPDGPPCEIIFDDSNSDYSERTTYYWVETVFESLLQNVSCPRNTRNPLSISVSSTPCNARTNEETSMEFGVEGFPCGSMGRIATVITHEMAHWLDFRSGETVAVPELPDTDGQQGMADGLGIFLLNSLQHPPNAYNMTGRGFWIDKCGNGLREHDTFKRTPEDVHFDVVGNNSEILSSFYWDIAQAVPPTAALSIYLGSICESERIGLMQDAVDAFCRQAGQFSAVVADKAEEHGFDSAECGVGERLGSEGFGSNDSAARGVRASQSVNVNPQWTIMPNPAEPYTRLSGELETRSRIEVRIYDMGGRLVCPLFEGLIGPGEYALEWHGVDAVGQRLPAGVYVARIQEGARTSAIKILLLRGRR